MKTIKLLLILILLIPCLADARGMLMGVVGGGSAAAAPSYLVSEDFDGITDCGDSSHTNCSNTWSAFPGSDVASDFNYATSPAPLEGTYSLRLDSTSGSTAGGWLKSFTAQDTVYFFGMVNQTTSGGNSLITILDSANNVLVSINNGNTEFRLYCGTVITDTSSTTEGQTYYIWGDYTKGTGSNAVCHAFRSTTTTKPAATLTITNGDATAQASKIGLKMNNLGKVTLYDRIRVSTSDITGLP